MSEPVVPAVADLGALLGPYLPGDHARQFRARDYIDVVMTGPEPPRRVVDLGCGRGDSVEAFRAHDPGIDWVGVDIADSIEAVARRRTDARFVTYDGSTVPLPEASVDCVFSSQVLEHVPDPRAHLGEVARILRPGGTLIGSTSQLEPYHSRSYWNLTPFGFSMLVATVGLELRELRPGIDGVTLTLRSHLGRPATFDRWWGDASPLNAEIDAWAREHDIPIPTVNLRKLRVCGQFSFLVAKPTTARPTVDASSAAVGGAARPSSPGGDVRRLFAVYAAATDGGAARRLGALGVTFARPTAPPAGRPWLARLRSGWRRVRRAVRR